MKVTALAALSVLAVLPGGTFATCKRLVGAHLRQ